MGYVYAAGSNECGDNETGELEIPILPNGPVMTTVDLVYGTAGDLCEDEKQALKQRMLTPLLYRQRPTWLAYADQKLDAAVFSGFEVFEAHPSRTRQRRRFVSRGTVAEASGSYGRRRILQTPNASDRIDGPRRW